jgi:hypothetical protein
MTKIVIYTQQGNISAVCSTEDIQYVVIDFNDNTEEGFEVSDVYEPDAVGNLIELEDDARVKAILKTKF